MRNDRRGFTLVETLVALALVGILATVVIPRIFPQTQPFEIAEQARRIHTKMARLRARAIAEQCEYQLQLASGDDFQFKRRCFDPMTGALATAWTNLTAERERLTEGTARFNGATTGAITFRPTGQVDTAGTIVIGNDTSEHTVRVLASGMTRWESTRK
jgi:prepilin-type N-terminal cleavage/methylation domain-containing protein